MNCFQIKIEDKVEYINTVEAVKMESKMGNTLNIPVKTNRCNDDSDDNSVKTFKINKNEQNSIVSEIKIEETQIRVHDEVELQEKGKDFKCSFCGHVAETRYRLYYHKRQKHITEDETIKCHFCSYKHFIKFKVFHHMKQNHKKLIKALKGSETERKMKSSTNNEEPSTSTNSKQIPIQEEEAFSGDDNIPLQQIAKDLNSNEEQQAKQTEELSSDEEFLKGLLKMKKTSQKKYPRLTDQRKCDECGKVYGNYSALRSHKLNHIPEEEKCSCPHCERKFRRKYELQRHIKNAHGFKQNIMCSQCSFAASSQEQLKTHNKIHHTDRPFQCDICTKKFTTKANLTQHSYIHSGITFKCVICSKNFRYRSNMIAHRLRHNLEKQPCKDCFRLVKDLRHHTKRCPAKNN